ncbi:hypothetical protein [Burkholderia gladioli]|uniref:hypothetical protein n=1 Tax=Burkholderia gladioli TaxID=28095 RepID=UPI003D244597
MVHPISPLGVVHTLIGLVPIVAALYGFVRYRKIDPEMRSGKIYLIGTVLSVITSFGVSSTGGLNAGHAFGVIVLLVAFAGALAHKLRFLGSLRPYLSAFGLSFSFLLSLVPATNETLTRLPPSHPLAAAPLSPLVMHVLITWFGIFIVGFAVQCWLVYSGNRGVSRI